MSGRLAVVASPLGGSFFIASGWPRSVDHDAVARVLADHGLSYSRLAARNLEFVAASDRTEAQALALAEDLRALGLHASIVPSSQARGRSARSLGAAVLSAVALVPGAGSALLTLAMLTVIPGVTSQVDTGRTLGEWFVTTAVLLGVSLALTALPAANLWAIVSRGEQKLAGTPLRDTDPEHALAAIRELARSLPDEIGRSLVERAEAIADEARREPEGAAAAELAGILGELRAPGGPEVANEARALRRDLARARDAVRETGP